MKKRILTVLFALVMLTVFAPTVAYAGTVTVKYNPGTNGEGSVQSYIVEANTPYQLAGAIYTRTGYVQNFWTTSDNGTPQYTLLYNMSRLTADLDLYPTWTVASYLATVNVNKDGSVWTDHGKSFGLYQSGTKKYDLNVSGSTATISALTGTYDVYEGASDTGVDIVVSSGGTNTATLNYYTLELSADAGTYSPNGGGIYLAGRSVLIDVMVNSGYTWNQWTSNNTALLENTSTKSTNITMPSGAVKLTANTTLNSYTISYNLNGGNATNPAVYQYTTAAFTLSNPTRNGYSFVGWSGTGLAGSDNQLVTITTASTGDKSYTANWKANAPLTAPEASIVTARADTSLIITTETEYEYSLDRTNWFSGTGGSYTFSGLTAGTSYNLVRRVAAVTTGNLSAASDASPALAVSTKNAAPAAPSISITSASQNLVIVGYVAGAEYSKDNGLTWQPGNEFNGLAPATQYTFAIRIKETDDTVAGIKATRTQYTAAATPALGAGYSFNYSTEIITISSGYQVSSASDFFTANLVASDSALTPGGTYYVRVAEAGGVPASDRVAFTLPARPEPPSAMAVSKTANTITITQISGQEYKLNSGVWQDSGIFTGLSPNTDYTVYTIVKATGTTFASADYSMSVTTKSVANIIVPTLSAVTYNPASTLAGITLPSGWAWRYPSTVPTVAFSGYDAVYTPTDTATVDYSGVTGYADTSGTVTITQAIGLTVNRATPTAADFNYSPPASLDYSGTSKTVMVEAKDSILDMDTVTVKYYLGEVLTEPMNAGTYTVKIDIAQGDNYAAVTQLTDDAWTFSIAKIPQESLSITSKPAIITYGDTFTLATTGGSGTGLVTWAVTAGNSATVSTDGNVTITGIGATTISATKAADDNHAAAITDTYTFTPEALQLTVDSPTADGGWTKVYDGSMDFDKSSITVGGIINKVGEDAVAVSVATAIYDTADIGSADKTLTITYAIVGTNSENYSAPNNTVMNNASITPATPTVALVKKTAVFTGSVIEIGEATVTGIASEGAITANYEGSEDHDGLITYTYYTKDTCTNEDKTTVDKSGAEAIGGAPKTGGTYYVKATIPSNGNYAGAESAIVTLTIYYPSSGQNLTSAPVIVDGKTVDMGTSEVKGNITTVVVDQKKMTEQLNDAKDSVVIPITSKTDTASAQLVMQNVESMAQRGVSLTVMAGDVSYSIPSGAVDTKEALKALGASDSSKVPFNITISKLSNSSVTIQKGTLMVPPVAFTVKATYNGKSIEVEKFGSYVQRVIEIPTGTDPKSITTAVVLGGDGTQRHVPTEVYKENGKWYARINSMTNSIYGLIENSVSFTDTNSKWYHESVTEIASREIISGIGENRFAGERAITRAEFSAILVRALGLPTESQGAEIFSDVNPKRWYYGVVGTAYDYGLVTGKSREKFDPNGNITRQESMTMIARAATLALYEGKSDSLSGFSDVDGIKSWALDAVKFNVGSGLIVGNKGKLRPQDEISRAETAAVVLRMLQNSKLIDVRE